MLNHALGDHDEEWLDAMADITELLNKHLFDEFGNYCHHTATVENHVIFDRTFNPVDYLSFII